MASILEEIAGSTLGLGALGVGAIVLAPTVLPWVGRIARPIIKEALKGGMYLYTATTEGISDIVTEANAEAHTELSRPRSSVITEPGAGG